MKSHLDKILVIKHGALGDLINATGAFSFIRASFPKARIVFLTSPAYVSLASRMGFFDEVIADDRPKNPLQILNFMRHLRAEKFDFIFDLQNSHRTALYHKMMGPFKKPSWSGIALGCSHPQTHPDRLNLHAYERFADQLRQAGLDLKDKKELYPDLSWMTTPIDLFNLPEKYALLVPGSSRTGAYKRWPALYYAELANRLHQKGIQPVLIGGADDTDAIEEIHAHTATCLDLSQKTSFFEIAALARQATVVVGNDTGPTHIAAGVKAPTLVLWSKASDPEVYAPKGDLVHVLFEAELEMLSVDRVEEALSNLLKKHGNSS